MSTQAQSETQAKDQQRAHWNEVAEGWGTWLEWTERNFEPVTDWLRVASGWNENMRLLDLASGAGYPALAAAADLPHGRVTATDLSPAMLSVAARMAKVRGLGNLEFLEMDAETPRFKDSSFDAVTHAYGLMFCPLPARAVAEAQRVLAPGGRYAVAVWDEPAKSPFFTVIRAAAEHHLALQPLDPEAPGPFRLASAPLLRGLLEDARFSEVRVDSVPAVFECASVGEYLQIFGDFAWKARVAALDDRQRRRFHDDVAKGARPFMSGGRLRLTATSLCACGRK